MDFPGSPTGAATGSDRASPMRSPDGPGGIRTLDLRVKSPARKPDFRFRPREASGRIRTGGSFVYKTTAFPLGYAGSTFCRQKPLASRPRNFTPAVGWRGPDDCGEAFRYAVIASRPGYKIPIGHFGSGDRP